MPFVTSVRPQLQQRTSEINPVLEDRLLFHKLVLRQVLEIYGISDLATMGEYDISGTVVCNKPGVLDVSNPILSSSVQIKGAFKLARERIPARTIDSPFEMLPKEPFSGTGCLLNIKPFLEQPADVQVIYEQDAAYWPGKWIRIRDDTTIVLKHPIKALFIIAERISVGTNVTFTWERPEMGIPNQPRKANDGEDKSNSTLTHQNRERLDGKGGRGKDGKEGGYGYKGEDAPEIEIWTLEWNGVPCFELQGQDGGPGGPGGDGGDGGKGARGKPWRQHPIVWWDCLSGPGNGGDGGDGGKAGKGGPGGPGGHGGRFTLCATNRAITAFTKGFYIDVLPGRGGPGGAPGQPGKGGEGGPRGRDRSDDRRGEKNCPQDWDSDKGERGKTGKSNVSGIPGPAGDFYKDAIQFFEITEDEFQTAFEKPTIVTVTPAIVKVGDRVSVRGERFTATDTVVIEGVECSTTVQGDTALSFEVPDLTGGAKPFHVKQQDGTLSANRGTIEITPTLSHAEADGE